MSCHTTTDHNHDQIQLCSKIPSPNTQPCHTVPTHAQPNTHSEISKSSNQHATCDRCLEPPTHHQNHTESGPNTPHQQPTLHPTWLHSPSEISKSSNHIRHTTLHLTMAPQPSLKSPSPQTTYDMRPLALQNKIFHQQISHPNTTTRAPTLVDCCMSPPTKLVDCWIN